MADTETVIADVHATNATGRRASAGSKRRHTREVVMPADVTNLPETHYNGYKVTRRHSRATDSWSVQLGNHGSDLDPSLDSENQGAQPARAAKIAAKAKLKALRKNSSTSSPRGHGRKKKSSSGTGATVHKVGTANHSFEEPMEVETTLDPLSFLQVQRLPERVIDVHDHEDYFLAPEYAQDIVRYMKRREKEKLLGNDLLANNPEVTSQMRVVLVDWLIQVQTYEDLEEETLQLTLTLTDQYLARVDVQLQFLQLLGVTCLFIAAKVVERFPPPLATLKSLTVTYTEDQIVQMERQVLRELGFDVSLPVADYFLQHFVNLHKHDVQVTNLASYLVNLSLPAMCLVPVLPSVRAASALYISRRVWLPEELEPWTPTLAFYTGHSLPTLLPTVRVMAKMLLRATISKYQGARQKFSQDKFQGISMNPVLDNHPALIQMAGTSDP